MIKNHCHQNKSYLSLCPGEFKYRHPQATKHWTVLSRSLNPLLELTLYRFNNMTENWILNNEITWWCSPCEFQTFSRPIFMRLVCRYRSFVRYRKCRLLWKSKNRKHFDLILTCRLCRLCSPPIRCEIKTQKTKSKKQISDDLISPKTIVQYFFFPRNSFYPAVLKLLILPVLFLQAKRKFERLKNDVWFKPVSANLHQKAIYKARPLFYIILQRCYVWR